MLFPWRKATIPTPLHEAVIFDRTDLISSLKETPQIHIKEKLGFTPIELAKLLGKEECLQAFNIEEKPQSILVQFRNQDKALEVPIKEFENRFQLIYRPFLTFQSYKRVLELANNLPYTLRCSWIAGDNPYEKQLAAGAMAPMSIRWIDSKVGYGAFAEQDLGPETFVGEFTGLVRPLFHTNPNHNAYCFHYPTRFWSRNYFAIDAFREGNLMRFVNHSDLPNLQPRWVIDRKLLHLVFVTKTFIKKGAQLTFNYGEDYWIRRQKVAL